MKTFSSVFTRTWRSSGKWGDVAKWLGISAFAASALVVSGCSDSADSSAEESEGSVYISMTDAEGDFQAYTVGVTSLTLTRQDGTVVDTLPVSTTVDFSQYVEMTEFVTAATIPSGVYVKGEMTLDFSNAEIWVEGVDGNAVQVAAENIVDETGNQVRSVTVSVTLEDRNQLLIAPGVPANLNLDFDLNSSNNVTFSADVPTVEVAPVLVADVDLEEQKTHRLRGALKSVDLDDSSYTIYINPFRHQYAKDQRFGSLKVTTTNETVFDINGNVTQGLTGLTELSTQTELTATIALGEIKFEPRRFEATEVYAGSSVPGGDLDVLSGVVLARSGDLLTLKGATIYRSTGSVYFGGEQTVVLANTTEVKKQLSLETHGIQEISVGQRVRIFGEYDPETSTLDATEGFVHLLLTTVSGTVVDTDETDSLLVADLDRIARTRVSLFDFTGTGVDAAHDADPDNYELNISTLPVSNYAVNTPFYARGFVQPFGEAPEDFDVHTLVGVANKPGVLVVHWKPANVSAIVNVDAESGLTVALDGQEHFYNLTQGFVKVRLGNGETAVNVVPEDNDHGPFLILQKRGQNVNHRDFSEFAEDLAGRLADGAAVKSIVVPGTFDRTSLTMTAKSIKVHLD